MGRPVYRVEIGWIFNDGHIELVQKEFSSFFFRRRKALRFYSKAIQRAIKNNGGIEAYLFKGNEQIGHTEIDVRK